MPAASDACGGNDKLHPLVGTPGFADPARQGQCFERLPLALKRHDAAVQAVLPRSGREGFRAGGDQRGARRRLGRSLDDTSMTAS